MASFPDIMVLKSWGQRSSLFKGFLHETVENLNISHYVLLQIDNSANYLLTLRIDVVLDFDFFVRKCGLWESEQVVYLI
jgi:hypothetical protein